MLVLSRQKEEAIFFPELGIKVTLLGIDGGRASFGIEAPPDTAIADNELARCSPGQMPVLDPHSIRNMLNSVNLFVMLYKRQIQADEADKAAATFMKMVDYLEQQNEYGRLDFSVESVAQESLNGEVMIVEDDKHQRELLSELLSTYGLNVTSFENGQLAVNQLLEGYRPAVAILDWSMPQFGGEWLVPKIREVLGDSSPRIFVVSGTDRRPEESAVDAWLAKPANPQTLVARIRAVFATA